jgi:hypothetical protein
VTSQSPEVDAETNAGSPAGGTDATAPVTGRTWADDSTEGAQAADRALTPGHADRQRRSARLEARKVRRLIRHVDPWSALKASLLFFLSLWLVVMIAAVIVWTVARGSGTVDKVQSFVESNLGISDWKLDGNFLFRQFGLVGLIITFALTLATTISAMVFNLISDIIGGVWITVVEEETMRERTS